MPPPLPGSCVVAALPWPWSLLAVPGAAGVAVSLAATWWVYDHSRLYDWRWALDLLPTKTLSSLPKTLSSPPETVSSPPGTASRPRDRPRRAGTRW